MNIVKSSSLVTRDEILKVENPFGCGDSPLFTYPFFGEEELIGLSIPPGTPESVIESLEIVLCLEISLNESKRCFLGISSDEILGEARRKIENKLTEMFQVVGSEIIFHHSWSEYQNESRTEARTVNLVNLEGNVHKLINPEERKSVYDRFQILLPFYIEAATPVDSSDPKWTIYLNLNETNSRVTGLLTTYSYFKFPEGSRVRISQVLILPRDQGHRLGTNLYKLVTRNLRNDLECAEICVEDPTDGFERLRGLVDWQEAKKMNLFSADGGLDVKEVCKKLKLTAEHAERLNNLTLSIKQSCQPQQHQVKRAKLESVDSKSTEASNSDIPESTRLRHQIKRWLLKKYLKDLPEETGERIKKLAELYETEMEEFIEPLFDLLK